MERNRKSHGTSRGTRERTLSELLDDDDLAVDITSSFPPAPSDEDIDQELQDALNSLSRVQEATTMRASDIEALLVKRRTPSPPR